MLKAGVKERYCQGIKIPKKRLESDDERGWGHGLVNALEQDDGSEVGLGARRGGVSGIRTSMSSLVDNFCAAD